MRVPAIPARRAARYARRVFPVVCLCVLFATRAAAQPSRVSGEITYVTSASVYVSMGTNQGFDVGDTLRVTKKETTLAVLVVTSVSSRSMATRILVKNGPLADGDKVDGTPRRAAPDMRPRVPLDTAAAGTVRDDTTRAGGTQTIPAVASPLAQRPRQEAPADNTVRGRVSVQYYALRGSGTTALAFSQPALSLQFSADHLFALPLQFTLYSNHRYDARDAALRSSNAGARLTNRIFQLAAEYGGMDAPFSATLGRFLAPQVGGVGTFDGAMMIGRSAGWEAGIAAGSQPGYRESEVNTDDPKAALFVSYTRGDWQSTRYQGGAAFAQTYKGGALDRGFIYLQNTLAFAEGISIYQNASIDMYDSAPQGVASSPHLSDIFLSASWRALRWLSLNGSVASRRNVYYLRSFGAIPDSSFDKRRQHDTQVSAGVNLPMAMFVSATGSLRARDGEAGTANALSLRYTWADVLSSETNLYANASIADNILSTSRSVGFELNREILQALTLSVRVQTFSYSFTSPARAITRSTLGIDLYARIGRVVFGTAGFEQAWESSGATARLFTDISVRF
ncbi:MAG: hypothetical protein HY962_06570 [Ignavibacteriae bacterium]|nr:hypothetical protein [Ignavibacteriota bacterium]